MHPFQHAATTPDKPAVIVAETGATMTYAELEAASNRVAQLFRSLGLQPEARVAFFLTNTPDYYPLVWGAQRAGLRYIAVSSKLTAPEVDYILTDSGAELLVAGADLSQVASSLAAPCARFCLGGPIAGFAPSGVWTTSGWNIVA
ncbi:MAG: AMP-binding protein [Sphingomonadales bacterium]